MDYPKGKNLMKALSFCVILFLHYQSSQARSYTVCVVGSGIGGASVAHFLRRYSNPQTIGKITIFERNSVVGGRTASVTIGGETFEAGGSILHPKNYHALNYTKYLNLKVKYPKHAEDSLSFGIWDGHKFIYKTLSSNSKLPLVEWFVSIANSVVVMFRYGVFSLLRMNKFVEVMLNNFLKYYGSLESRPVFESVEAMLKWAGLYNLTARTLGEELIELGLSPLLIQELVTVITRINYGQSVNMSGLAGAVSLAGSGGGLWSIEGGNWQLAAGLINRSDVELHLHEEIELISYLEDVYELNSTKGDSYNCDIAVVATPLDELSIHFTPGISIPPRKLQHTHATFVRGLLNPAYFHLDSLLDIPELVGTIESPDLPFSSISILKQHETDNTYKIFSRQPMPDSLLDAIFSMRTDTIKINWGAYPHYQAPEKYAPFILDDNHLYYINAFENAASAIEASAVSAENIARLILSRLSSRSDGSSPNLNSFSSDDSSQLHSELPRAVQLPYLTATVLPKQNEISSSNHVLILAGSKSRISKQPFHSSPPSVPTILRSMDAGKSTHQEKQCQQRQHGGRSVCSPNSGEEGTEPNRLRPCYEGFSDDQFTARFCWIVRGAHTRNPDH